MSAPRLSRALGASAGVHLLALGTVLVLAHPHAPPQPPLRVSLVPGSPTGAGGPTGPANEGERNAGTTAAESPATTHPTPARPPADASRRSAARDEAPRPGERPGQSPPALAGLTAVQDDLWVLGAPGPEASAPHAPTGPVAQAASAPGGAGGTAPASNGTGSGVGGSSESGAPGAASLLDTLQRRLAWSAARCAPAAAVRLARHGVPGVPLHFCLDASGRPSEVGLLGTTGSDQLDRAARDCVVPGALPLPPAQGCYTVEVRFPIRG
ncbi:MAG: hypothetical protein ACXWLA_01405 [Myxococcaceae bacterium]